MPNPLFESVVFAPLLVDERGEIRDVGRGWSEIFDVAVDELRDTPLRELALRDDRGRVDKALDQIARGAPSAIIRIGTAIGGRARRLRLRLQQTRDGILVVAEDITVRRGIVRGEALSSLVDHAHDGWFVHDMDGRILDCNPWACESLGYTRSEMLALQVADFETTIQPGRLDGVWSRMEVGRPLTVEGRHRRKDGSEFPVEVRLGLFDSEDDQVLMLAIVRDISKRKEAEQRQHELTEELKAANADLQGLSDRLAVDVAARTAELKTAVGELEATFEHLADGLCSISCQGAVRMVNTAFLDLFGIADATGMDADDALPDEVCDLVRQCLQFHEIREVELLLPGDRIGKAVASPIGGRDPETLVCDGVVVLVRDVTLEKEIDRMKTDFIATVSHELRTPLTSVLGFAKLTSQRLESRVFPLIPGDDRKAQRAIEQVRGNVEIILAEGQRLTALINDVLDISKMESGRMEWDFTTVDPALLLERALHATAALFEGTTVELKIEVGRDLPVIQGDHDRLMQVLINLISNAAKFTHAGAVEIGVRSADEHVEFWVRDTGEGIDPALHSSIFEKFKQVGDTLTAKPQGTGLGLPISRQIVTAHRGSIRVDSAIGEGSCFTVQLPLGEATPDQPERIPDIESLVRHIEERVPASSQSGADVLVVDDDPSLRELLRQQLTDRGCNVRLASNGREAMQQVRDRRPDLVILDVMMPELSGFDVAAMLKADPSTASIPILILSIVQDRQRGYRLGVDRYLTKPADPELLLRTVDDLLERVTSPRRVLVVDEETRATPDVVKVLEAKGFQVVGTCTGPQALDEARRTEPDLILVESSHGAADLIRTIRFERGLEHVFVVQRMPEGGRAT